MAYKEKRYGKKELKIFTGVILFIALVAIVSGIVAVLDMTHWSKYIILGVTLAIGIALIIWGIYLFSIISATPDEEKSVRDGNDTMGTANATLCDKCGRVLADDSKHCEHCGAKQEVTNKVCAKCNHKNSKTAKFCKSCGEELK
ncbi:MAG: double zinc ribbon domain-containing protein [Clostridia bacterium]